MEVEPDVSIVIPTKRRLSRSASPDKSIQTESQTVSEQESFIIPNSLKMSGNVIQSRHDTTKESKCRNLADWSPTGPSKQPRLDLIEDCDVIMSGSESGTGNEAESREPEPEMETLNESHVMLDIRTIENSLEYLKKDAADNGDLIKISKEGNQIKFHEFWVKVRCPGSLV